MRLKEYLFEALLLNHIVNHEQQHLLSMQTQLSYILTVMIVAMYTQSFLQENSIKILICLSLNRWIMNILLKLTYDVKLLFWILISWSTEKFNQSFNSVCHWTDESKLETCLKTWNQSFKERESTLHTCII